MTCEVTNGCNDSTIDVGGADDCNGPLACAFPESVSPDTAKNALLLGIPSPKRAGHSIPLIVVVLHEVVFASTVEKDSFRSACRPPLRRNWIKSLSPAGHRDGHSNWSDVKGIVVTKSAQNHLLGDVEAARGHSAR